MKIFLDRDYFFNFVKQKKMTIIKVAVGLFVLALAFIALTLQSEEKQSFELNEENSSYTMGEETKNEALEKQLEKEEVKEIFVDVSGAVVKPDVYKLKAGARVFEAIKKAGGFTENANAQNLNLAAILNDQDKLVILTEEEFEVQSLNAAKGSESVVNTNSTVGSTLGTSAGNQSVINLNTASQAELETLKGVGPAMAQRIIDYRNTKGGFSKIEELKNVKGIGEKMFEKVKESVGI